MSEWARRQREREDKLRQLEKEYMAVHNELMDAWQSGDTAFDLNRRNCELIDQIEEARREVRLGLKAKPTTEK